MPPLRLCTLALVTALAWPLGAVATGSAERAAERQRTQIVKAWFPDLVTARRAAISLHGELLETDYAGGFQVFELDGAAQQRLREAGYRLEPATDFLRRRDALLDALDRNAAAGGSGTLAAIPGYACYETVEESFAAAQALADAHPSLARWSDIGDSWEKSSSGRRGYDMRVLVVGNGAVAGAKPKLVITSAIHAREYVTAPLALAFARWLVDGYGSNADATWLVDHHEVHFVLQSNPDGRKKAESGLSWRKNTNTAYCGARSNNRGADLNRNFSFGWNSTNGQGSSGSECNLTYRGPGPASEPETQAIETYIRSQFPDSRGPGPNDAAPADTAGLHLDLHSYSELVLWPWGDTAAPAPNGPALQTLGRRFAFFNGYTPTQSIGLYPTDGTSDGPSYGDLGVAAFTFELGTSFFQDCDTYEGTIRPRNLPALVYAAKVSRAPYLLPAGPDVTALALGANGVAAGTPVALSAAVTDTRFNQSNGVEPVQAIAAVQAFVDVPPWAPGAQPLPLAAADGAFDSSSESAGVTLDTTGLASGRHTVFVRGIDAAGDAGPVSAVFLDIGGAPPPSITLTLGAQRVRVNQWDVALGWANALTAEVDVYRNGALLATTANDGAYVDSVGRGSWRYRVCERGAAPDGAGCSPEQRLDLPGER